MFFKNKNIVNQSTYNPKFINCQSTNFHSTKISNKNKANK